MSTQRAAVLIAAAGIIMQIITGIMVASAAIKVIETRVGYAEAEVTRLRQWRENVVDPKLQQHDVQFEIARRQAGRR